MNGSKRLSYHADLQTISRCHIRSESEDHTGENACKWGVHPGLETEDTHHQYGIGISVTSQKELVYSKKKIIKKITFHFTLHFSNWSGQSVWKAWTSKIESISYLAFCTFQSRKVGTLATLTISLKNVTKLWPTFSFSSVTAIIAKGNFQQFNTKNKVRFLLM